MAVVGEWLRRLGYLLRRRAHEDELRREMEAHRAQMGEPQTFGNMVRLREDARDAWGWRWLDDFAGDTRFAWRTLRHSPGFAITAVATLALGIGVNSAMFTLVDGLLLRPLYGGPGEMVGVYGRSTAPGGGMRGVSYPNYRDLSDGTASIFESLAAASTDFVGVDTGGGVRRTLTSGVTANYFDVFGVPLALGRPFTTEEERLGGSAQVAIVSHGVWQQQGGDADILGRSIRVDGERLTIVGVAAEGFTGGTIPGPEVWTPVNDRRRDAHWLAVVGRLRDDVSIDAVGPALATVARRLEQAFPDVNSGYTLAMASPSRLLFMPGPGGGGLRTTLAATLMLMPVIVLLVACLNLADLVLARGHMRRQELAVRSSLGGGRGRLTRQLLTEGLLLSLVGGGVGLLFSTWATSALLASLRPVIPVAISLPEFGVDWRVFAGTVAFSLLAALVFGAWPAWSVTGRAAVTDLKRHSGDAGRQPGGIRLGRALVVVQVALSLLLLASGGLFLMSALSAATVDPGFRLDGGLLVEIDPGLAGYDGTRARQSHLAIVDRLRTVPGVEAVTIGSGFPFSGFNDSRDVAPAGVADASSRSVDAIYVAVGRDHARVFGLPLLAGRDFTDAELRPGAERVAIVDDLLAARLWPGQQPVGQLLQFHDEDGPVDAPVSVVGIVPAVKHSLGNPTPFPHVYVPLGQDDESHMLLQLRATDDRAAGAVLAAIDRTIREVDADVPILRRETWRAHIDNGLDVWIRRAGARVFSAFGLIALLLSVIGVYGVKSYVVARRTREFGIRLAAGAEPRTLLWQVLWEGGRITAIGIVIGLVLAVGAGRFLQGVLSGVNDVEPAVLVTAPIVLIVASLLASFLPALRATRVNPTVALRSE